MGFNSGLKGLTKIPCLSGFYGLYKTVSPTRVAPYRLSIPWPASLSPSVTSFSLLQLSLSLSLCLSFCHTPTLQYPARTLPSIAPPYPCALSSWRETNTLPSLCDTISELLLSASSSRFHFESTLYQFSGTLNLHLIPSTCLRFRCRLCLLVVR